MEYFASIKETDEFQFQKRNDHWLGNGVYFFIDDHLKAKWWARMAVEKFNRKNKNKKSIPCVLYLEAKTDIDKVIDLNVESGQGLLKEFIKFIEQNGIQINIPNDESLSEAQKEHFSRCALMDLLAESGGYVASCYQFPDKGKPYGFMDLKQYGIINNKGNQLCVYDQKIIDFSTLQEVN